MYQEILVPLDHSGLAESALPAAVSLAERSGGRAHLVSVVSPLPPFVLSEQTEGTRVGWVEERLSQRRDYLEEVRNRIEETGSSVPIRTQVLSGEPVRSIHEWILENGVDQVVMTTHGRGGVKRLWLGSVADGLVRRVPCPVLLWRPGTDDPELEDRPSLDRVLAPLDGSELAEAILPWAEGLVRHFGGRLFLVSVVPGSSPVGSPYLPHLAQEEAERQAQIARSEAHLAEVAERARRRAIQTDAKVLSGPSAAEGILSHADEVEADVIVLSTHGRGGITRMVMGSVADKVIRGSQGPVLVHLEHEEL